MMTRKLTPILVALVMVFTSTTFAQPASDLMEKGIYTEETVGDLDAAIGIYQQILEDAETNRKLAASAQYRLATCYLKKGQDAEATEAFEKLIENYPDQTELIAQARKHMPGRLELGPVPWEDGEVARMLIKLPTGKEIGTFAWTVNAVTTDDGQEAWRVTTRRYVALNGSQGISGVITEAQSFKPISSWFYHTVIGNVDAVYTPSGVQITGEGRDELTVPVAAEEVLYDNEQAVHLMRRLPLEVGYKSTLPIFVTFSGKRLDVEIEVEAKETISVPAGEFEAYKVVLEVENLLHQEFWFSADANKYPIKFNADGIVGELISVGTKNSEETVTFEDQDLGFSIATPSDWYLYEFEDEGLDAISLQVVETDAVAFCGIHIRTVESAEIDPAKSMREQAEGKVAEKQKRIKGYTVRPDSWNEHTIGGMPAISFIADFENQSKAKVEYRTYVLGDRLVGRFKVVCDTDDFDTTKPKFDQLFSTFKAK